MKKVYIGPTYSLMHELMASATQPMPADHQRHQLTRMWDGLANMERQAEPSTEDWRVVSDAVNFMETLITGGPWPTLDGGMAEVQDTTGALNDALEAMALAGARHLKEGKPIRLSGLGMVAVRGLLEDYAAILAALPHRAMIKAHRKTEQRIREINSGKRKPHDVEVIAL